MRDPERAAAGQKQYLARNEKPVPGGGGGGGEGVPPQPAASVRPDVLRAGEGYRPIGGHPGAQQHRYHQDIHHGIGRDAQEAAGEDEAGDIKAELPHKLTTRCG